MSVIRIFDPNGLLEKSRELKKLEQQIEELMDRILELKESRLLRLKPKEWRRKIKAL